MSARWMLLARLDALIARLRQASQAIESEGLNARLQKRIGSELAARLARQLKDLQTRRRRIPPEGDPISTWDSPDTSTCERLFDECLTFLQAARSRGPDVAPDLCEITDTLFEELAGRLKSTAWRQYSVFSTEDSFDPLTDIVRLRYPLGTVWDIPVAAHEFGHFISRQLKETRADGEKALVFQDHKTALADQKDRDRAERSKEPAPNAPQPPGIDWRAYLDEVFGDVFATYAIGPAFAYSAILLRFDPLYSTTQRDRQHPPDAHRVYAIVQTLNYMNREEPRGQFSIPIQQIQDFWRDACRLAGTANEPSEDHRGWIDGQVSLLYGFLNDNEPALRFREWKSARAKVGLLETEAAAADAANDPSIAELLNIAWICRFKPGSDSKRLGENFLTLAHGKTSKYEG